MLNRKMVLQPLSDVLHQYHRNQTRLILRQPPDQTDGQPGLILQRQTIVITRLHLVRTVYRPHTERPVKVVGHVRHLLIDPVRGVRHDSPRRPPARSAVKRWEHSGQVTAIRVWPSALIRR